MTSRPTVVFTTNYPMDHAHADWEAGLAPGHHLWGIPHLERAGYPIRIVAYREPRRSNKLRSAARSRLGDVRAELTSISMARGPKVLYAADVNSFAGLSALASLGLRSPRVVAVVHPDFGRGWAHTRAVLGHEIAIAISRVVYDKLIRVGRTPDRTVLLPWGPDLEFSGYASVGEDFVVSSGKTLRDVDTLAEALARVGAVARIHYQAAPVNRLSQKVEARVRMAYADVLFDLRRASVVAIPLTTEAGTVGLTELNDALALGKPVIMTRNRFIDVDIDAIGCGVWVDAGDVDGWTEALDRLLSDDALRAEMGRRGKAFAAQHWNADLFGRGVTDAFSSLARS